MPKTKKKLVAAGSQSQSDDSIHAYAEKMTERQKLQSMVDAGILSPDHKYTEQYGGTGKARPAKDNMKF